MRCIAFSQRGGQRFDPAQLHHSSVMAWCRRSWKRKPSKGLLRPAMVTPHRVQTAPGFWRSELLAESKASDQTIMAIAGHVSKKMLQHYSHVRLEAKRDALDALTLCVVVCVVTPHCALGIGRFAPSHRKRIAAIARSYARSPDKTGILCCGSRVGLAPREPIRYPLSLHWLCGIFVANTAD